MFDGDSLTSGDVGVCRQEYVARTLEQLPCLGGYRNFGVGGQTIASMVADATTQVDPLYDAGNSANVVVCWGGSNDNAAGTDATTIYNNIVSYCQGRQAAGWKVVVVTMLPRGADADVETRRQAINTNIRNNWPTFADALGDVAADSRIGDSGDQNDTVYYLTDATHLTRNGNEVVAGIVKTAISGLL